MDGLLVKNIPQVLLARILVQLYIIPQKVIQSPRFNLISILVAGLRDYGASEDLDGFFSFCARQSFDSLAAAGETSLTPATWRWKDHILSKDTDWDLIDQEQLLESEPMATELTGIRLQIASEQVRAQIELVRYGKKLAALHDERLTYNFEGHHLSMEGVLNRALEYMSTHESSSSPSSNVTTVLKERLKQLEKKRQECEQAHALRSETDFVLMGALMAKLDVTQTNGAAMEENGWYLYLRDYVANDKGSTWRIIKGSSGTSDVEMRVSSFQVLADLRGSNVRNDYGLECVPSPTSNDFRPVYLFYCNNDIVSQSAQDAIAPKEPSSDDPATSSTNTQENTNTITLADYTFDNENDDPYYGTELYEMDYELEEDEMDSGMCKFCGIADSVDNINTIFFCDDCNQGVHQLCEQPNIAAFEMDIDPWYCRACCRKKGLPLPSPPDYLATLTQTDPSGPTTVSSSSSSDTTRTNKTSLQDHEADESNVKKRKLDK